MPTILRKTPFGSVSRLAAGLGIPVYAPDNVNHPIWVDRIAELAPDIIFSFYYRNLLSEEILHLARLARSICTVLYCLPIVAVRR